MFNSQVGTARAAGQREDALQLRQLPAGHGAAEPCDPSLPTGSLVSVFKYFLSSADR